MSERSEHHFDLNFETQGVDSSMRDLTKIINSLNLMQDGLRGWVSMARRMNLPENFKATLDILDATIAALYALRAALIAVQAASGPVGWLMLGIGAAAGVGAYAYGQMEMDARTGNY